MALTAELFGGDRGLGFLLNLARQDFDTPLILVVIFIIIIFVYSTERFVFTPLQNSLAEHHAKSSTAKNLSPVNIGTIINISLGWLMVLALVLGWWAISNNISDLVMPGPMMVANSLFDFFFGPYLTG